MKEDIFDRCLNELLKEQDFIRLNFLRALAQISVLEEHRQIYLAFYGFYQLAHRKDTKATLQAVEQGLTIHEETLPMTMLLVLKAAVMTRIGKHTDALQITRDALDMLRRLNNKQVVILQLYRKAFPPFMAKALFLYDFSRGKREFLVLLDEIKVDMQGRHQFASVQESVNLRMQQIREHMRCLGKNDSQKKLAFSNSYGNLPLGDRDSESSTSIYINRLYEERRKNLGQREKTGFKKVSNPYQLNVFESRASDCYIM